MEIVPEEVRKKEFRTVIRGYDPREVDDFLDEIVTLLENLQHERQMLNRQVKDLEDQVADFRKMEGVLKDTLSDAHSTTERLRSSAAEEAEQMVNDARVRAEKILADAHLEQNNIQAAIRSLHGQRMAFIQEMEGILDTYGRIVDRLRKETEKDETED
jgi:cell division initiation protein